MRKARPLTYRILAMTAALSATAALSVAGAAAGVAGTVTPTGIQASAATSNTGLGGAVPAVLTTAGAPSSAPFTLTVTLVPAGATFTSDTALNLTATVAGGAPNGSLDPARVTMPAGRTTDSFTVSYSAVANDVQVTAAVAKKGKLSAVLPGTTAAFDVLKTLETFGPDNPALTTGLGVGNADCTQATTESECGTLVLSNGFSSAAGALSLGACTTGLGCTKGSQVVQFIADLGSGYSTTNPALLIVRCAKTLCHGGGVNSYTLKVSFSATGPLNLTSAPCVTKGVALDAAGNTFCTDYVQSHRDNAGDTLLYFLFTEDMRGST